jgi:hypothetical protein
MRGSDEGGSFDKEMRKKKRIRPNVDSGKRKGPSDVVMRTNMC